MQHCSIVTQSCLDCFIFYSKNTNIFKAINKIKLELTLLKEQIEMAV